MSGTRRDRALLVGRIGFVLLTVVLAWWGFHGRWDEIGSALRRTDPLRLGAALGLTGVGLLLTALLWWRLVVGLGSPVQRRGAAAVFLVGQLGKYIPGSVWSFAAQARLGRRHRIPGRTSVAASSVFLLLHTFTGVVLGCTLAAAGALPAHGPRWMWAAGAVAGAAVLAPPLLRRLGARIAGQDSTSRFGASDLAAAVGLMVGVWLAYGAAVRCLLGPDDGTGILTAVGAFALSHAAGVLLAVAPAGLGAREGVLIALLAPTVGIGAAAAVALLGRVVHTVADFAAAALASAVAAASARGATTPQTEEIHVRVP